MTTAAPGRLLSIWLLLHLIKLAKLFVKVNTIFSTHNSRAGFSKRHLYRPAGHAAAQLRKKKLLVHHCRTSWQCFDGTNLSFPLGLFCTFYYFIPFSSLLGVHFSTWQESWMGYHGLHAWLAAWPAAAAAGRRLQKKYLVTQQQRTLLNTFGNKDIYYFHISMETFFLLFSL